MAVPSEGKLWAAWKDWRHLALLWAAVTGGVQQAQAPGFTPHAAGMEALHDPARLREMLSHAVWFRSFAISFVPERATAPLIPPEGALQIVADVEEIEPNLAPLPPEDLAAATVGYRAPTKKFFE
jgi:hypothetical protein